MCAVYSVHAIIHDDSVFLFCFRLVAAQISSSNFRQWDKSYFHRKPCNEHMTHDWLRRRQWQYVSNICTESDTCTTQRIHKQQSATARSSLHWTSQTDNFQRYAGYLIWFGCVFDFILSKLSQALYHILDVFFPSILGCHCEIHRQRLASTV